MHYYMFGKDFRLKNKKFKSEARFAFFYLSQFLIRIFVQSFVQLRYLLWFVANWTKAGAWNDFKQDSVPLNVNYLVERLGTQI